DFKGYLIHKEYTDNLKNKVEEYIAGHPQTSEEARAELRNFKVVKGMTAEQVKLLLGEPERIQPLNTGNKFRADARWVYMMKDTVCIYVVPVPLFFTHNAYHLYFKNGVLVGIEEVKLRYS
ncbi:MAG: hypothetical protein PHF11_05230, partial [Candidatus Omnitrophica bacterium]|nr:hypothetical protein [Candidatus Omnitrophota bacterium]